MSTDKYYYINQKIRAKELRVITNEGENLGVISTNEALQIANQRGLDLVVIAPNSEPQVAKIMDFKKFLYQENKEKSKSKVRSKKSETKEIMFKPFTADGDLKWQIGRAKEWLTEGNKVKVWVAMKGRASTHPEISMEKIKRFETELSEISKVESPISQRGHIISMILIPR